MPCKNAHQTILVINYLSLYFKSKQMKTQTIKFDHLVKTIYNLSLEDRLEIKTLLEHNIAESRRDEIAKNLKESLEEFKADEIRFSSDTGELRNML